MPSDPQILSDVLGLVGAFAMAVPWFRDFGRRLTLNALTQIDNPSPQLRRVLDRTEQRLTRRAMAASWSDLLCNVIGLILLMASFALKLWPRV